MKYQNGEYEVIHREPVWRNCADFIFAAHIGCKNGKNEWEQMWGKKISTCRFILCCIPFFVYDIALGDEIETNTDFIFQRVVRHGGQSVFRVWFGSQTADKRIALVKEIEVIQPLMEWSSENLLALSVSDGAEAQKLANYLQAREEEGLLQYETGRSQ